MNIKLLTRLIYKNRKIPFIGVFNDDFPNSISAKSCFVYKNIPIFIENNTCNIFSALEPPKQLISWLESKKIRKVRITGEKCEYKGYWLFFFHYMSIGLTHDELKAMYMAINKNDRFITNFLLTRYGRR